MATEIGEQTQLKANLHFVIKVVDSCRGMRVGL